MLQCKSQCMKSKSSLLIAFLFLFSCGGGGGGGSAALPLPIISIAASSLDVNMGDEVSISWSVSNADACNATGRWSGIKSNSGNETVTVSGAGNNNFGLSCSGEGGQASETVVVFAFNLAANNTTLSVDEDGSIINASVAVEPNTDVVVTYTLLNSTSNGTLTFNEADATLNYFPSPNYNGVDEFTFKAIASERSVEKDIKVTVNIASINDAPTLTLDSESNLTKLDMVYESNPIFNFNYSDVDHSVQDLSFTARVGGIAVPASFNEISEGYGSLQLDLASLDSGGLYDLTLSVFDGSDSATESMNTWFVADKSTVTFEQDDDPEDGVTEGSSTTVDYNVYYLDGNSQSNGRTTYLFVADSLASEEDRASFRSALVRSINKVKESDAGEFISGFFTIKAAEPVVPDGKSPSAIRTGCYDFDPNIYCIGDMDISVFEVMYPGHLLVSTLTMQSGRGVNLGNRNIQPISSRTQNVLMHELGHAHGFMGDEYRSDDDRDVSYWADLNINTTTQSDPALVKWKHLIPDPLNVLGQDIQVCYNWEDGTIADFDNLGLSVEDCQCFINIWDENGNFLGKNPDCSDVGLFEGNYYGLYDNYRPTFCSIMDSCSSAGYQEVNAEGFAVGSIHNQGFYDSDSVGFITDSTTGEYTDFEIVIDGELDTSKLTLKWYINGVEEVRLRNQLGAIFPRPANNAIEIYTYRITDLTGTITAPDEILVYDDFYEGLLNSDFQWNGDNGWAVDPVDKSTYDYGYMLGPLGASWGINWSRW